ncbi:calcium-binding protein [Endozoicomonas sp.]|nr:calcium-binding protein [Endozoicomonas sp.]
MSSQANQTLEDFIQDEVIVDCYDDYERINGWHCWLDDQLAFPFKARCIRETRGSILKTDEVVTVTEMADFDECNSGMRVQIEWQGRTCSVPLEQLDYEGEGEETQQAVDVWHYWSEQGYRFL